MMTKRHRHEWSSASVPRHCARCGVKQYLRTRSTKRSKRGFTRDLWMAWPSGASKRTDDVGSCVKKPRVVVHGKPPRHRQRLLIISPWVQKAVNLVKLTGCTATHAAGLYGVDPAGVARQARRAGVDVRRGRPKKKES